MRNKEGHLGPCRIVSECVYAICKFLHLKGDYKINIIHYLRGDNLLNRGHAWVTRDDKDLFLTPSYRPLSMSKVGENDKYCYWISIRYGKLKRSED